LKQKLILITRMNNSKTSLTRILANFTNYTNFCFYDYFFYTNNEIRYTTNWRNGIKTITSSAIKGIEDGASAAILMMGIGLFTIMFGTGVLPPLALLAAIMCVVQVQNVCDPTNTHNVWIANFTGIRVEELTKETILPLVLVCLVGLIVSVFWFF
jgi:hypothetical protein